MTATYAPLRVGEAMRALKAVPGYPWFPCPVCGALGAWGDECGHGTLKRARAAVPGLVFEVEEERF